MQGFTFPMSGKTVFVKTTRERKTKSLAKSILKELRMSEEKIDILLYRLQKGECEPVKLSNGDDWYFIKGKGFGECTPANDLILINVI